MFVNCYQNGQLGLYQNQCTIHSLSMGVAHSRLVHIASPTSPPYVGTQFPTQPLLKCLVYGIAAPTVAKLRILVKAQPCTPRTWPLSPTRLGIRPRDLGLPNEYTLGHCGLSAASRHRLASTSSHHSLLTAK